MSVMGIDLNTLHQKPCVEGYSTPGGYSSNAVHPIALAKVMQIAQKMKSEFSGNDLPLFGIGGVETRGDATEFILLGASTVQSDVFLTSSNAMRYNAQDTIYYRQARSIQDLAKKTSRVRDKKVKMRQNLRQYEGVGLQ